MKIMRTIFFLPRAVLTVVAAVASFAVTAQEASVPASTNAAPVTNAMAMTNEVAPANAAVATNLLAQTNTLASTNSLGLTNQSGTTNTAELPLPSEGGGKFSAMTGSTRLDSSSFRVISERNIFNPNRSPRYAPRTERREYRRPNRVDSLSLVGTMSYEKGQFAFFDGSSYEFRKTLKPSDSIAGYKVIAVGRDRVLLAAGTNALELKVGTQMRREDEGAWHVGDRSDAYPSVGSTAGSTSSSASDVAGTASTSGTTNTAASSAEAPAAASGDAAEILKRLMQRREQEMNK